MPFRHSGKPFHLAKARDGRKQPIRGQWLHREEPGQAASRQRGSNGGLNDTVNGRLGTHVDYNKLVR
jgi:hypothetical protein